MAGVVAIRARGGRRLAEIARVQAEVQAACSEANKADGSWMHAALLRGAGGGERGAVGWDAQEHANLRKRALRSANTQRI